VKEKPPVTVILSSYNHENYITQAVESIVNQTYGFENIELIGIDDCSMDNTGKIFQELSKKYRFEFFQNTENKGLTTNRNWAIKRSKGAFICGCGSDDYWDEKRLDKQVSFMEKNPNYAMCYARVNYIRGGKIVPDLNNKYKGGSIFKELLVMDFHMPAPTYMIRRSVFDVVGLYDENLLIEDWYMNLKIAKNFEIGFLDDYVSYYRIHDSNISRNVKRLFGSQRKILEQYKDSPYYKKALNRYNLRKFYMYSGYLKLEAIKLIPKVLRYFYSTRFILGIKKIVFGKSKKVL